MKQDNVFIGDDARDKLMAGVNKVADAVKGTLGASGYNALLADPRPPYAIPTNDGISVARAIYLEDPVEMMGANLMREIGTKSDKDGGDGTTTSITLAQAILNEGLKETGSPMEIKRSLEECLPLILKSIDDQTKPITVDEVGAVASISAEDEEVGKLIQEIYQEIGKNGILYPDISRTAEDYYEIGQGVKIEGAGLLSPFMSDTDDKGTFTKSVTIKDPKILLTKQKIGSAIQLEQIVNSLYTQGIRDLVVFCDEIEGAVVPELIMTRTSKASFRIIVVKVPTLWKDEWFEDVAKMVGATVIDPSLGVALKDAAPNFLGTCGNLVIDKYDTYFDGIKDLSPYIAELEKGTDEDKIRGARLNTKTARLFIGADSESALAYKRLKVEDARNAAWQALHSGVVVGGGICLLNAARTLPDTIGGRILAVALKTPTKQICANAGHPEVNLDIESDFGGTQGYNAKKNQIEDLMLCGVVDANAVTKNAVINALSVASIVLTTKVICVPPQIEGKTQ